MLKLLLDTLNEGRTWYVGSLQQDGTFSMSVNNMTHYEAVRPEAYWQSTKTPSGVQHPDLTAGDVRNLAIQ